jgi:hypothetical protein
MYGVAVRDARAVSARRRAREVPVPTLPDHAVEPDQLPDADALRALDEEVAALPDHVRPGGSGWRRGRYRAGWRRGGSSSSTGCGSGAWRPAGWRPSPRG